MFSVSLRCAYQKASIHVEPISARQNKWPRCTMRLSKVVICEVDVSNVNVVDNSGIALRA
jgi:hypothetical protein